ncbi:MULTISPECIES: inorganic phosphate transporter [Pseudomonas]|uniref:inorganic phosphate transporter n=1 Tax=Pseudomonas TaxID=286 RepID=UPI0007B34B9D|nr:MULTISPECIES: inorganic phosphate transporter [Pseudomonas]AZC52543.1 Low-affinity inorganic phosphate transporter [Pseudomonas chlororaphis subsp. piscium]AZC58918.1 Low-affinity inorganic phosphate transporter [Pseudomonas chlororaphis subsp. piscium]AZC65126.1 Low-affinity inorganic phosphate transporter [Pseudomonas chlororaphis subsp. piscium]AZC71367.1 Low-affinity inorganic phosphate transporter [Pseudomonas chlororaphis subsp. piscium]AZC77592.1 Low-affinity inorganic phosphate tran
MATPSLTAASPSPALEARPQLDKKASPFTLVVFFAILAMGLLFTAYSLMHDMHELGTTVTTWTPFLLLGVALLIALGFEFVNGFHDTANAVATVIYTHSLPPHFAVVWSGFFNFLGVLLSSGAVAFGIIALLPVELILQVGSSAGFAMIFALLIAAILWNLGTWWLGLPASSSHTLIGSIIGVGVANALMHGRDGTSGVDWSQATKVGYALLFSPLIGFAFAALLLLALRLFVKNRALYKAPKGNTPPPWWIRGMLIVTCTGVSFAHGSNDGQKGMGLIMLILVGTLPMAYALNRTMPADQALQFAAVAEVTQQALVKSAPQPAPADPRAVLSDYVRSKEATPQLVPALAALTGHIGDEVKGYGSLAKVPAEAMGNVRNDMYLSSETIRLMDKNQVGDFDADTQGKLQLFKQQIDNATRFIPLWVKIAVAIALGLGTMVGWKRIVVTVGEKIGKTHLTYAQGASAETVAMLTIGAADMFGLPVSTTHVLSSGVAGTMVANGGGLQMQTIRNLLMAWVLTLPAAILLSGSLYWLFTQLF